MADRRVCSAKSLSGVGCAFWTCYGRLLLTDLLFCGSQRKLDGTDGLEESFCSASPIADPVPHRQVSASFKNASKIRDCGSVRVFGHDGNHQGKENLLLFPASDQLPQSERKVRSRERLGGLLRFYHREAA